MHLEHQVCNVSNSQVMPKLIDVFQDYLETYMTGPQSTSSTSQFKTMKTFPYNEICTVQDIQRYKDRLPGRKGTLLSAAVSGESLLLGVVFTKVFNSIYAYNCIIYVICI